MKKIQVGISGRHIHLSQEHLDILFGKGYNLTVLKELSQPGQYAATEKLDVLSPQDKSLKGVRILGPVRSETQIEISRSDSLRYRFIAPVRSSGDVKDSGKATIIGPKGQVSLNQGVIIADRHIHFSTKQALEYGITNKQIVSLRVGGIKAGIMDNVLCRVHDEYNLDCHLDTDDGSAFMLSTGDMVELIKSYTINK